MSEGPRVRSLNVTDSDHRPVLGPAGNKARPVNPVTKPHRKVEKAPEVEIKKKKAPLLPSVLRQCDVPLRSNLSMNASCSSDASTDSSHSRGSSGRVGRRSGGPVVVRRKACGLEVEKEKVVVDSKALDDSSPVVRRCAWVTPNTEPCYVAFHDEEWGVPVHEDKKLFELLVLSGALAELTWPAILNKRHIFREVFLEFDPMTVAKLSEKKIAIPGSAASSLLSELKLRAIIENARQIVKIIDEFGSFDKYIWNFVNHKPIVGKFRYPRQVPVKTSKADAISKDLVKRGFRSVSPTVIYSFMQVSGITNDHLISCFRFQDCISAMDLGSKDNGLKAAVEEKQADPEFETALEMARVIDELSFSVV